MTAGRRRRVVGVIIDGDVLRGVEMRRSTRGRVAAVAAAEVAIPEGVLEGSLIVDHDGIAAALRLLWVEGGFKTSNLAYGISGRDATMRLMTVPAGVDDEIAGLARYELADRLPYPMDEAVTDVQEIARRPEAVEVLAAGVRTSVVESIATVARAARLSIDTVGLIPISLASAIPAVASDGTEALVSIDGSRTTVVLRTGRSPRIVRVLASGGGYLHDQLADELASAIAEVDHFRRGDTDEVTADGQQRRFHEAVDAVMAAIRFDQGEHAGTGELNRVLLTGAFGEHDQLHRLMAAASGVDVVGAVAPPWWRAAPNFDHFVEAAAVAHSSIAVARDRRLDLQGPTIVASRRDRRERTLGLVAGIALAAIGTPVVAVVRDSAAAAEQEADSIEALVPAFVAEVEAVAPYGHLKADVESRIRLLGEAVEDDLWWDRLLTEIAAATPTRTFLTSASMSRPVAGRPDDDALVVTFSGVALDQADVGRWLDAMSGIAAFDEVWLVQATAGVFGEAPTPIVDFLAEARLTPAGRSPRSLDAEAVLIEPLIGGVASSQPAETSGGSGP